MKLIIASDLHGSTTFTERTVRFFEESGAEKLILLGDLLYHGPRNDLPDEYGPKKVIELLNVLSDRILAVRGNCDAEVDQMVLSFPIMSEIGFLQADSLPLFLTHGHHIEEYSRKMSPGNVLLSGHTHIPKAEEKDGVYYLNPGSTSIPKGGSPHSLIFYEDRKFSWIDLSSLEPYKTLSL